MLKSFFTEDFILFFVLTPPVALLALIAAGFVIHRAVKLYKNNQGNSPLLVFVAILLLFVAYQIVPCYFFAKGEINEDTATMRIAAKTAVIPCQKGFYYLELANLLFRKDKKGPEAIDAMNTAYKYTRGYDYLLYLSLLDLYIVAGEYDKALEISQVYRISKYEVIVSILNNDYKSALKIINKQTGRLGYTDYGLMALIYRNLGDEESAERAYFKALELCKANERCAEITRNWYENYATAVQQEYREKAAAYGFTK